jgi:ferredoxin-like protein FixX
MFLHPLYKHRHLGTILGLGFHDWPSDNGGQADYILLWNSKPERERSDQDVKQNLDSEKQNEIGCLDSSITNSLIQSKCPANASVRSTKKGQQITVKTRDCLHCSRHSVFVQPAVRFPFLSVRAPQFLKSMYQHARYNDSISFCHPIFVS